VCIGVREAASGQQELSIRELLAEHFHERDRATAANKHWLLTFEDLLSGLVELFLDIFGKVRGRETITSVDNREFNLSSESIILLFSEFSLEHLNNLGCVVSRSQSHGHTELKLLVDNIPSILNVGRHALNTNNLQAWTPPVVQVQLVVLFAVRSVSVFKSNALCILTHG